MSLLFTFINAELYSGNKVATIKAIRGLTNLEFEESKDAVETLVNNKQIILQKEMYIGDNNFPPSEEVRLTYEQHVKTLKDLGISVVDLDQDKLEATKQELKNLVANVLDREQFEILEKLTAVLKSLSR